MGGAAVGIVARGGWGVVARCTVGQWLVASGEQDAGETPARCPSALAQGKPAVQHEKQALPILGIRDDRRDAVSAWQ